MKQVRIDERKFVLEPPHCVSNATRATLRPSGFGGGEEIGFPFASAGIKVPCPT